MGLIRKTLILAALCAPLVPQTLAAQGPNVVVSLKPVHALVAGVMGEAGKPRLLLKGTASPHTYQMRPSDAKALAEADLIVWIGEGLETFLDRPIENLGARAKVLTLDEAPGLSLLRNREGGIWEEDDHEEAHADDHKEGHADEHKKAHADDHEEGHADEHKKAHAFDHEEGHADERMKAHADDHEEGHADEHRKAHADDHEEGHAEERMEAHAGEHEEHRHDHGEFNMHVWLEPGNARRIVDAVAGALAGIDPGRADAYRANAAALHGRIAALDTSLRERLAPLRGRAFVVFHDAYQYFERAYGLNGKGAVAVDPARAPSAKRLVELRAALVEHDVRCVFTEPQFEPDLVRTVIGDSGVRTAVLDPIGADTKPGPDAWAEIMRGLGDAMVGCLGG